MGLIKNVTFNISLALFTTIVMVVLADVMLYFTPLRFRILPPHEPRFYMQFDTDAGYDIATSFPKEKLRFSDGAFDVWSNSLGCFDEEYTGEQPYIYLTGDSFAWGWAPLEQKWGKYVESIISTRVLTCGVNGYGTRQELIKAKKQLEGLGDPSVLIVSYLGANDVDDDLTFPNHTVYSGYQVHSDVTCPESVCTVLEQKGSFLKEVKLWFSIHSVVYTLVQRHIYAPSLAYLRGSDSSVVTIPTGDALPKVHTDAMLGFKSLAAQKNTHLIVVLVPSKDDVRKDGGYSNERMKKFLEDNDIAYIDLLPAFKVKEKLPEHPLYWMHDGHWNEAGNTLAGLLVGRYLIENRFILTKDKTSAIQNIDEVLNKEFPLNGNLY